MINTTVWGKCSSLAKSVSVSDTELTLPIGDGVKFKVPDTDHFYITVRNGGVREVMKVVGRMGDKLRVERGQDNTTAQTFAKNSCFCVEWNPQQLCEFVKACTQSCTNISPQTHVISCGDSIQINECGNIVKLNGRSEC